jgi:hypothetical protein
VLNGRRAAAAQLQRAQLQHLVAGPDALPEQPGLVYCYRSDASACAACAATTRAREA